MLVIGLTGQFCCGKSTVAKMFARLGAVAIDVDRVGHKVLKGLDRELYRNRKVLAREVFTSRKKLKKLCSVMHPMMVKEIKKTLRQIKKKNPSAIAVLDAAVLVEMALLKETDYLIVVKCKRSEQLKRAKEKWKLTRSEILSRINSQTKVKDIIKCADFLIDNSDGLAETKKQVKRIWEEVSLRG